MNYILVIIGNYEPIITVIMGNNGTVIIGNNEVITEVIIEVIIGNNTTIVPVKIRNHDVMMM